MTTPDPKQSSTPPAGDGDGEAGRIATIDQKLTALKDDILGEVRKMFGGAQQREREHLTDPDQTKTARAGQAAGNLDQMIADAIKVNDDARAKAAADQAREDRLKKLEDAGAEKTPVQRGKMHRFMGWGEPPQ